MDWNLVVMEPIRTILTKASSFVGLLIAVIVILAVGWIVAKAVQKFLVRFLKLARMDVVADKAGVTTVLARGEIKYTLSELIGVLVYWLIMLIVFVAAINALNLTIAAELLDRIVSYIPNVVASIFILVLGMFISTLVSTFVSTTATNAGVPQAKLLGKVAQVVIIVVAIAMTLEQLKIASTVINLVIWIIMGAIGLASAIAFGLGCKDIAGKAVKDTVEKLVPKK